MAQAGKKVLLIDADLQASLTISLGHSHPGDLPVNLSDVMGKVLTDESIPPGEGILHHDEGVDLMPSSIQLSCMEVSLVNAMSRETILRQYLDTVRKQYTHILIDCQPSLSMLTVNALAAANRVLVPVRAEYLPAKGLEQLLQTIAKVRWQINPRLQIDGILLTMVDSRTNFTKRDGIPADGLRVTIPYAPVPDIQTVHFLGREKPANTLDVVAEAAQQIRQVCVVGSIYFSICKALGQGFSLVLAHCGRNTYHVSRQSTKVISSLTGVSGSPSKAFWYLIQMCSG